MHRSERGAKYIGYLIRLQTGGLKQPGFNGRGRKRWINENQSLSISHKRSSSVRRSYSGRLRPERIARKCPYTHNAKLYRHFNYQNGSISSRPLRQLLQFLRDYLQHLLTDLFNGIILLNIYPLDVSEVPEPRPLAFSKLSGINFYSLNSLLKGVLTL